MKFIRQTDKSWPHKIEHLLVLKEAVLEKMRTLPHNDSTLEELEYTEGLLEAAEWVCKVALQAELARQRESPELIKVFSEKLNWHPIGFCRHFMVWANSSGQRRVDSRGPMAKLERTLSQNTRTKSDTNSLRGAFEFMLGFSHLGDLPNYNDALLKIVNEDILPCFGKIPIIPGPERNRRIKALRKSVIAAFDLASASRTAAIHQSAKVIHWTDDGGKQHAVLPAFAAIQCTKKHLAEFQSIPTKLDIRESMERCDESLIQLKDSFWSKVWAEAGLQDLPERPKWGTS